MRGFFRFLFGFIFIITIFVCVMIFTLKSTVLTYEYIQTRFEESDLYTKVYNSIPELTKMIVGKAEKGELAEGEEPPFSSEQIGKIIADSVNPKLLKEKTESFLTGFYHWLYGEGSAIPEIGFSDIKPKLETSAAAEMNIPISFIRSESSGFVVPEKLKIEPIPPLLLARKICSNYNIVFYSCLFLSLISIIMVSLMSEDGLSSRLKKPGTPMIIVSIWLLITAGIFWLFFNAGDLLYKTITEKLGSAPQSETILYHLISGIINDITVIIFAFAAVFLVVGIGLKIAGHFVRNQEVKQFQKEHK